MPNPTRRFLLAAAGACFAAPRARAASPKPPAPAPSPVLGVAVPLSGELSLLGDEALRGIQLAADTLNAAGGILGKPVAFTLADAIDQSHAAAAVNTLITQDHANLVLGATSSALAYPASAAAELAQVPYIELTAPAASITARGFHFLLHTGPTTSMIADLAVATLRQRFAGRKIGLLFNTGATGGAIAGAAIRALDAAKTPVLLAIGYPEDVTDLYAPAGRLKRAGVEVVLHAGGVSDVLAFFLGMQAQNWRPEAVLGCDAGYLLASNAAALGAAFEGTMVIGAPCYPPAAAAIAAAYQANFATPPRGPESLSAYVGAKLVFDTLGATGGDPSRLPDAMRALNLPMGSLANGWGAAFDHTGQNTRSFVTLQQWRGQQLVPVG